MVAAGDAVRYRVRLRDVAKQARVAPSTASAVLNGRAEEARIAPPTQERVRAAAAELGYRPNLAARNLRSHTSRIVGLVSDAIAAEPYAGEMVRGAYAAALTHDRLLRGIRAELDAAGGSTAGLVDSEWSPASGRAAVTELLAHTRPAALICLNDRIALGAYQAVQQAGLRIPQDVSVVAFDDSVMAGWLQPGLSSVALPHYEMGRLATDLLIKEERHRSVHLVDMLLRRRDSIGPPAR